MLRKNLVARRLPTLNCLIALFAMFALLHAPVNCFAASKAAASGWPVPSRPAVMRSLQYMLRARGFAVKVDGKFGPQTRRQVIRFQRSRKLKADGTVGAQTWNALIRTIRRGDRGDMVRAAQTLSYSEEYDIATDGVFGPITEAWIKSIQNGASIKVDGIVGPVTWKRLLQAAQDGSDSYEN